MTITQLRHFEIAHRKIADQNEAFLEMVGHKTNPMTREDLAALIKLRPARYQRFEGWLAVLPSRG